MADREAKKENQLNPMGVRSAKIVRGWRLGRAVGMGVLACAVGSLVGCSNAGSDLSNYLNLRNSFMNPAEVGRFDKANPWGNVEPVTWPILNSLAVNDPPPGPWPDSRRPTVADLIPSTRPYVLGAGDVVTVSVFQLVVPDQESVQTRQINTQGDITLDFIGTIKAKGLTTRQLRRRIVRILIQSGEMSAPGPHQPGPQVNVDLTQAKRRVFSIIGGARAGTYNITSPSFRLLDALALAGNPTPDQGVRWIYVIRSPENKVKAEHAHGALTTSVPSTNSTAGGSSGKTTAQELETLQHEIESSETNHGKTSAKLLKKERDLLTKSLESSGNAPHQHFVYVNHHWVPLPSKKKNSTTMPSPVKPVGTARYQFSNMARRKEKLPYQDLVIRIRVRKLLEGNPRENIIIRPGDIIRIPSAKPQYYYVMGNVNRPGVYTLTGQRITLKMAVAAAGNLGGLAIPRRCELVRRIGKNQETIIQVNLQAIFDGQEPDIFLKPNDVLNVGTDAIAPFLAIFRNGFQAAYGFGFTYDRNFYIQPVITQGG
jgi:protein involved in polysaccharide export with SLBB domain